MSTSRPEDPELPGRLAELGFALRLDFERTNERRLRTTTPRDKQPVTPSPWAAYVHAGP